MYIRPYAFCDEVVCDDLICLFQRLLPSSGCTKVFLRVHRKRKNVKSDGQMSVVSGRAYNSATVSNHEGFNSCSFVYVVRCPLFPPVSPPCPPPILLLTIFKRKCRCPWLRRELLTRRRCRAMVIYSFQFFVIFEFPGIA